MKSWSPLVSDIEVRGRDEPTADRRHPDCFTPPHFLDKGLHLMTASLVFSAPQNGLTPPFFT